MPPFFFIFLLPSLPSFTPPPSLFLQFMLAGCFFNSHRRTGFPDRSPHFPCFWRWFQSPTPPFSLSPFRLLSLRFFPGAPTGQRMAFPLTRRPRPPPSCATFPALNCHETCRVSGCHFMPMGFFFGLPFLFLPPSYSPLKSFGPGNPLLRSVFQSVRSVQGFHLPVSSAWRFFPFAFTDRGGAHQIAAPFFCVTIWCRALRPALNDFFPP